MQRKNSITKSWRDGRGGPTTLTQAGTSYTPWSSATDVSLVRFTADPNSSDPGDASTVWWVDHATKTMRPIMSMQALLDIYDGNPAAYEKALQSINILPPEQYSSGPLSGYIDLGEYYGIFERGQARRLDFNPRDLGRTYGKTPSEEYDIGAGLRPLNSFISLLSDPTSGIDPNFLEQIKNDKVTMALYMNALAYGGYSPDDIYKDIKRRELLNAGDTSMADVVVINSYMDRDNWVKTNPGARAQNTLALQPPDHIGNVSRELWNSPAVHLNDDYYRLTDPERYDPTSQEFRDALAELKPSFYDYIKESLAAQTDAAKAIADEDWREFRDAIEKQYGYRFHDNALEAWRQFEKLESDAAEHGIAGSGILSEAQDRMLRIYREANKREREEMESRIKTREAEQAIKFFSPEEIKKMIDEDKAAGLPREEWRAYKWGLVPKEDVSWDSFLARHRELYPDDKTPDAEIKSKFYDNLYDQYGNYRSSLYQNYQNNYSLSRWGFNLNQLPGTSEEEWRSYLLMTKRLEEEKALGKDARKIGDEDYWSQDKTFHDYGRELPDVPRATTAPTTGTTPYHIKSLEEMKQYLPSQYFRDDEGKYGNPGRVYLRPEVAPKTSVSSPAPTTGTTPYHIRSMEEMHGYDPTQYFRDTAGKYGPTSSVYLNIGLTPDTAKKVQQAAQNIVSPTPAPAPAAAPTSPIASPSNWVDPATGMATSAGVGMLKSDYDQQKSLGKL